MSRLQEHFLEKLAYQNEQRRLREEELKQFQQTSDSEILTEITETDNYTTNYDDDDDDDLTDSLTNASSPKSIVSSTSISKSDISPINTFAYPDDASNPFQLPPRDPSRNRNGSSSSYKSNKSSKSDKSKKVFFSQGGLTTANLNRFNAAQKGKTATSMLTSGKPNMITTHTSRPLTPSSSKMKYNITNKPKRGYSDAQTKNGGITKLKRLPQSISNPSSPHARFNSQPHALATPQVTAGAYRLGMCKD